MFADVYAAPDSSFETLLDVARDFSPRVEMCGPREVVLDLTGLTRLFGDAKTIAGELRRTAADRGLHIRIAIAGTRTAARLLVRDRAGITIVNAGDEAAAVETLRIELLEIFTDAQIDESPRAHTSNPESRTPNPVTITLRRWGLRTLGDLAALPADDVAARLGQRGVAWQRLARGEDPAPLVPSVPEERFEQALDLEWPIDGLEPLSFVLARLMEPLSAHLERRDRGAAVLHVRLHLVTRELHERSVQLPAPMRDARTLRTLALLDLESHPPAAAIDRVVVAVDPTPGRVIQFSLLTRPLPSPEQLSTLMARLTALMGEGRCGSAVTVDSWEPGAFDMKPFGPGFGTRDSGFERSTPNHIPTPDSRLPTAADRLPTPDARLPTAADRIPTLDSRLPTAADRLPTPDSRLPTAADRLPTPDSRLPTAADRIPTPDSRLPTAADRIPTPDSRLPTAADRLPTPDSRLPTAADRIPNPESRIPRVAVRRFRFPVPARVYVDRGIPVRVTSDRRGINGGKVETYAGPWRTSGGWWMPVQSLSPIPPNWDRDEWDVTLSDGVTYRVFRERDTDAWFIEGVVD